MKLTSMLGVIATAGVVVAGFGRLATAGTEADAVALSGRVVFEGEVPEAKPLAITEKASEGCCPAGTEMDDTDRSLLLGAENGIANVVVTVTKKGAEVKPMTQPIAIDQKLCRFEPHIMVVPIGSDLEFLNSDTVSHNVHTYPTKHDPLNQMVAPGSKLSQKLTKSDKIKIACDIHPWMNAYVYVTDTPYYTVTDKDGNFKIDGLDAGEYTVEFWHEKLGKSKQKATVGEPVSVKMGMEKKKGKGKRRRR